MRDELKQYLTRAMTYPQEIHLESNSGCNARCTICPREGMTRYQGDMPRALFLNAITDCMGHGGDMSYIHFHLNGEPLLMDINELCWRIDYTRHFVPIADHKRMTPKTCFFTNGSLLDGAKVDKILSSQLDIIVISIDGGNKEDYENIRKGLTWETVVENVRMLVNLRNYIKSKLWIQTAIIPQMANRGSLDEYFKIFKALGVDDVGGSGVQNIGGLIDSENMIIKGNQYEGGDVNAPCWRVFLDLSICADGKAVVCCQDVRAMEVVGDLNTQTIPEIWQGERMMEIRDSFVHGRKHDVPFCKNCDYMRGMIAPDFWSVDRETFKRVYEEVLEELDVHSENKS